MAIIDSIKRIMPNNLKAVMIRARGYFFDTHYKRSYSQEGEDMILDCIFVGRKNGFYVDVGAHHPRRFSNTYSFYLKGWRGINIDATPGSMILFDRKRPRDINLEIPISSCRQLMKYYLFNEPAFNSFSRELSLELDKRQNKYYITSEIELETLPLRDVLNKYMPKEKSIDFLSVDVEGCDYDVLVSNDWDRYRPEVVLVEIQSMSIPDLINNKTFLFLVQKGYRLIAKTFNTAIFTINNNT